MDKVSTIGVFLLFSSLGTSGNQECSYWKGSVHHGGFCYKFFDQRKTWNDAMEACQASSPSRVLAEFPDDHTAYQVMQDVILANNGSFNSLPSMWVGGFYGAGQGQAQWAGTNREITLLSKSELWLNDTMDFDRGTSCLSLTGPFRHLSFQSCDVATGFVCQERVGSPCPVFQKSLGYIDGRCFFLSHMEKKWEAAKKFCESYNFSLAEPDTPKLMDFLLDQTHRRTRKRITIPQGTSLVMRKNVKTGKFHIMMLRGCGDMTVTLTLFETEDINYVGVVIVTINTNFKYSFFVCLKSTKSNTLKGCKTVPASRKTKRKEFTTLGDPCTLPKLVRLMSCLSKKKLCNIYVFETFHHEVDFGGWTLSDVQEASFVMGEESPSELVLMGEKFQAIFLGAIYTETEGRIVWNSSGKPVNLPVNYWTHSATLGGSKATPKKTHVEIGTLGSLSTVDGEEKAANFICQMDVRLYTSLMVVPGDETQRQLHVTTESVQMVLFYGKLLSESGTPEAVDELTSGVSHQHPFITSVTHLLSFRKSEERLILLESTKEVTIVVYSFSQDQHLFTQLLYPTNIWSSQYIVYPYGNLAPIKTLYVALEKGKTQLGLESDQERKEISLNQFEAKASLGSEMNSGILAHADKRTAVFSIGRLEGSGEILSFPCTPLDSLSNAYVTIPAMPFDPFSLTSIHYVAVAVYANTTIKTNAPAATSMTLLNEGDMKKIIVPANGFFHVSANKPFYLSKSAANSPNAKDQCTTPILPSLVWRASFHFTVSMGVSTSSLVYIAVISKDDERMSLLLNGDVVEKQTCPRVRGTDVFKACYFSLGAGYYHLRLVSGHTFMAYLYGILNGRSYCHPLGAKRSTPVTKIDYNYESYRKNLQIPTTRISTTHSTPKPETPTTSQDETVQTSKSTNESVEETRRIRRETTSVNQTGDEQSSPITESSNAKPHKPSKQLLNNVATASTTVPANKSCVSTLRCQCRLLDHKRSSLELKAEIEQLRLKITHVSSYRRKKMSVLDSRPTSLAAGYIGIAVTAIVGSILLLLIPDLLTTLKYLKSVW